MSNKSIKKPQKLLRLGEVEDRTGLKKSSIYSLIKISKFPKQIKLSQRSSAWLESEVDEWIAEKISARG